jgi:hypothetical protein
VTLHFGGRVPSMSSNDTGPSLRDCMVFEVDEVDEADEEREEERSMVNMSQRRERDG